MATRTLMAASGQRDWNHDSRQYESSKLGVVVVEGFQRLRQGSLLCDTQLVVQGQTFSVHRAYLASCSPYFYSMFTENFQEKSQNRVLMFSQMCCILLLVLRKLC